MVADISDGAIADGILVGHSATIAAGDKALRPPQLAASSFFAVVGKCDYSSRRMAALALMHDRLSAHNDN